MLSLPHRYDRYRLVALVLQHRRKLLHLSEKELADASGVAQSTISRLVNPGSLGKKGSENHKVNRMHLLALTRVGLRMDHHQASVMLWLSEGEDCRSWRDRDFSDLQLESPTIEERRTENARRDDPRMAHLAVVDLLEKTCIADHRSNPWYPVETYLLQGNSPLHHVALFHKLRTLESGPGQRMLVSKYPSILVSTDISAASELLVETAEPIRAELREMLFDRQKIFRQNLARYGERAIHSLPSLRRFTSAEFNHRIPLRERKKRVRGLIKFLEDYEKFQLGLLDEIEPEIEIAIKSTQEAVVRGTARELSNHPQTAVCGPSYMYWSDERAVLSFYLDFERLWAKLHEAGLTEKDRVIVLLRKLLR